MSLSIGLLQNLFTSDHIWDDLVSLPAMSVPPLILPAVLTQPCYLQVPSMLSHLQLCLVFHYRCP